MGLNVAVFVPEGIVLAADSMAFVRTEDEGYFTSSERIFSCLDRFVISFIGNGYIGDMPYGYIVNNLLSIGLDSNISTAEFAKKTNSFISQFEVEESLSIYVAGIDIIANKVIPYLYLLDKGNVIRLNAITEECDAHLFYNYHAVGQSLWINKLFLPTTFEDTNRQVTEEFVGANIDFRRFSLDQARSFAAFLVDISAKMEVYTQMRPTINQCLSIAILKPFKVPEIIK